MIQQPIKQPAHRISVNDVDISNTLASRLVSLTLVDYRGSKADQLTLVLDDSDGALNIPSTKARLSLAIGWRGEALVEKGEFIVDEFTHSGPPDRLTLVARAADFTGQLSEKVSRSWHQVTLGDLLTNIAKRHNLTPAIGEQLATRAIEHIDQTGESDSHFLTRLAKRYGAFAAVKSEHLVFKPKGDALSVSGKTLPPKVITRGDGDRHRYNGNRRDQYTGVRSYWHNQASGEKEGVFVGNLESGEGAKVKELRAKLPTQAEASQAAQAEWQQLQKAGVSLTLDLALADPALSAERPVTAIGYKKDIDAVDWVIKTLTHTMGQGYQQGLDLEVVGS